MQRALCLQLEREPVFHGQQLRLVQCIEDNVAWHTCLKCIHPLQAAITPLCKQVFTSIHCKTSGNTVADLTVADLTEADLTVADPTVADPTARLRNATGHTFKAKLMV